MKKRSLLLILVLMLTFCLAHPGFTADQNRKPVDVILMTPPFGTTMYNIGAAFEQVFRKAGSWVHIKHQETPGAMYMIQHLRIERENMIAGKTPYAMMNMAAAMMPFVIEGRKPLDMMPLPNMRSIISTPAYVGFYGTFDPNIKTLKDFSGKRVCTAERSRLFQGLLVDKPLFEKGVGNYDKIKWAMLGSIGCKDAMLNNKVDVVKLRFLGKEAVEDGKFIVPKASPDPPTMELLSSGRKMYFIPVDAEYIKKGYNHSKDLVVYPHILKKGAYKGIEQDMEVNADIGNIAGDVTMPDDVIQEIVRVRYQHMEDFGKYHASLKLFPDSPYPLGSKKDEIHPGVFKAMEKLGLEIPKTGFKIWDLFK
ncbi:MAG: hypothetical protein JRJ39_06855 [Deltaproteobacteria bacterium]|nr:hypothetical protein [Deltaproteobacteria bacterium]MBW1813387.1 hypothetical protein [Deltaproteobacteria bacterium]MBW1984189.1 hypothetical protein [Deltaproteobacteria bacterium]MBW2179878.1 hypothetical protein [Deltaproteobacteria bacterium]